MFKLFTLAEATRLLPVIEGHVAALQSASRDATEVKRRLADIAKRPGPDRAAARVEAQNLVEELGFLARCAQDTKADLDRLGVELTDLEDGAVAIPASVGGEVVALTWARGQPAITHYRRLAGDTEPHPLPSDARVHEA